MSRWRLILVAGLLLATGACSVRDFLTRRLAYELISSSETFNSPEQFWLRTGIVSNKDYIAPDYLVLQKRGWITAGNAECPPGTQPPPCWEVNLTPLGADVFRPLMAAGDTHSQNFGITVARRQLLGITGISRQDNTADVEFVWKWLPLNEVGAALYSGGVQYSSAVSFVKYDDGWRVKDGKVPPSGQDLSNALKNAEPVQ
jgi:hypothetical protein